MTGIGLIHTGAASMSATRGVLELLAALGP